MSATTDFLHVLANQAQPQGGGLLTMVGMFIFIFAFMYIFTIRPQRVKERKHQEAVSRLKKGDEVMLESGIFGEIFSVEKDTILVKIADKVVIKVHQRGIRVIMTGQDAENNETTTDSK